MTKQVRKGFTLIELLIFSGIFGLIIGGFITILISMVSVQSNQSASGEVSQQGQFLNQQLQYYIESARLVDMAPDTATSTLVLREPVSSSSTDPITLTLGSGVVYLRKGISGSLQPLTSNKVTVSNLSFTRHYNLNSNSSALGTDSVSYSFTVSTNLGLQSQFSQTFQSSASVLASVPVVALLQQAKAENNTGSNIANISAAFGSANESGDLLVAVAAFRGTATMTATDTAGNTWTQIASATYPGSPSGTIAVFAAVNAKGGTNTTTITFGTSVPYVSLYLYEYRGAATASAFDTAAAQTQSGASPSSPSVSPSASGAEFLMGIDVFNSNGATLSPGSGYTLETTSTPGNTTQVGVEDSSQYISNPVSAGWTASSAVSSTAMIVTFASGSALRSYDTGIAGHWALDEGNGSTAIDSSGNSYTGTWRGTPSGLGGTNYNAGKVGSYAGSFVVANSNAVALAQNFGGLKIFTISLWVKTTDTDSNATYWQRPSLFGKASSGNFSGDFGIITNSGYIGFWTGLNSGNDNSFLSGTMNIADNAWHLVTVVDDGASSTEYVDGVAQGNLPTTLGLDNVEPFAIGARYDDSGGVCGYGGGCYYSGTIDDVRFYNRALSLTEIQTMYNIQK